MRSWLWQRLDWRGDARDGEGTDRLTKTRVLASLYLAAATLGLLALVPPHSATTSPLWVALASLAGYLVALLILLRFDDVPERAFPGAIAFFSVLVSFGVVASGDGASAFAFFYLWVALYSAYFFSVREAAVQGVVVGVSYAAVLALQTPAGGVPFARWLITIGTLVVSGGLVMVLRRRVARLIETLSDAARTDALTGLANRRSFERSLELELERARRSRRPLTLLVADIDRFKHVNDTLGHQAGDAALRRAAEALGVTLRRIDTAARIGGEEFAILAPECDCAGALALAERLRREERRAFASDAVPLTLSIGVAVWPMHGQTPDELLRSADQALYTAKELGRDRAVVFNSDAAQILTAVNGDGSTSGSQLDLLLSLAEILDTRDGGTSKHSQTVGRYSELIARELGLPTERVERVRIAGILHDLGKIGIPDAILRKPGPLADAEWAEMRRHPEIGARLVRGTELADIRPWIAGHHERPDGRGYPLGLPAAEIPLEAAILAVADAYEAMTSDRCYRQGLGAKTARTELVRSAGTQFDAQVVGAFLRVLSAQAQATHLAPVPSAIAS